MIFLEKDWKKVNDESRCFEHCIEVAGDHFDRPDYSKAIAYIENAKRSLLELEQMKKAKEQQDQEQSAREFWLRFKQLEGQEAMVNAMLNRILQLERERVHERKISSN